VRQRLVNIIAGEPAGITAPELKDRLYASAYEEPVTMTSVYMLVVVGQSGAKATRLSHLLHERPVLPGTHRCRP
jgi:hypothetical protein